jgi:uncharacterized SAM-binding protein YcdF (DUF218 family)
MLIPVKYIVVLANEMDANGVLNEESASRAEFAGELALGNPEAKLVTPGWAYRQDSSIRIGKAMKDHILKCFNLAASNIVCDLESKDTVGDAVYCRELFDDTGGPYSVEVVTSDYHCERTLEIFSFVFGSSVDIKIRPVSTKNPASKSETEKDSTLAFRKTFSGIPAGDFTAIKMRLVQEHPLYTSGF